MKKEEVRNAITWIRLLNDQTEWKSLADLREWFSTVMQRPVEPDEISLRDFWQTLNLIRTLVYNVHFGRDFDPTAINPKLANVRFAFHSEENGQLPIFRAVIANESNDDSALLQSLAATVLLSFSQDLGNHMAGSQLLNVIRCEGLYRDPEVSHLSPAPDVSDDEELAWRQEVSVLVERGIDRSPDVLRCADFFVATARSRFCSDSCRTTTFQIIKQLVDPIYLADKQRRYRSKKR